MTREDFLAWLSARSFTQSSFASELGVSPAPVSRWGKTVAVPKYAARYMRMFDQARENRRLYEAALLIIKDCGAEEPKP